jgi:hypothetical protein
MDRGLFSHKNLIVVGDFNFTLSEGEIWGEFISAGSADKIFQRDFFGQWARGYLT